jgi:2-(1,2-epoxy-1,2-dihydrophenyl)acetyl-CoA isomerase
MSGPLVYSVEGAVATIAFNRPQVINALDAETIFALRAACERARDDAAVRVIVLRGNGPAFVAGGDIGWFHANLDGMAVLVPEMAAELHRAVLALREAAQPVIASVHGAVAGAGMSLLAAADLAIAADETKFSMAYSAIGTSPDGGSTWFLPRLVGARRAMELLLLPEPFDAATAQRFGLVNRVVPAAELEAATAALAKRLAAGPTQAYAETKALVNRSFDTSLVAQLDAEAAAFGRCAATRDFAEGVTAFVGKRKAKFEGR